MTLSRKDVLGLAVSIGACLGVSAIGGAVTRPAVETWYRAVAKPWITPPDWVFAPVWISLYVLMGVAAWRVWRRHDTARVGAALSVYGAQLALNLAWSFIFFGAGAFGWALAEIVALWTLIVMTTWLFWRIDRLAGLLFVPYALWVSYAVALNAGIWSLNPP